MNNINNNELPNHYNQIKKLNDCTFKTIESNIRKITTITTGDQNKLDRSRSIYYNYLCDTFIHNSQLDSEKLNITILCNLTTALNFISTELTLETTTFNLNARRESLSTRLVNCAIHALKTNK